ncbi:MAG: integrase core domain-containing protein [Hyphomicrobiaceae bacterium]
MIRRVLLNKWPSFNGGEQFGIRAIQINPSSPWENGFNERFNGTKRREVLNAEWFNSVDQARVVINQWLRLDNHVRPHQALYMRPPVLKFFIKMAQDNGALHLLLPDHFISMF